jgi:hypothetical protein
LKSTVTKALDAQTNNRNPAPTRIRPKANFMGTLGSRPRFARSTHKPAKIGPKTTMMPGLKVWVWAALNQPGISVDWSANRVKDEPACSNRVQNRTENMVRMIAASIFQRSSPLRKISE